MTLIRTGILAACMLVGAGAASAADLCGAEVHTRYGETRAYFRDVLGACRPDGYCSAVVALADPTGQGVYAQQLRIARPAPGAPYLVEFVAVTPMNAGDGQPMSLAFGAQHLDLSGAAALAPNSGNQFEIAGAATVAAIVTGVKAARAVRWTYQSGAGPATAIFGLRGMTAALQWIDCAGAGND